MIEMIVHNDMS